MNQNARENLALASIPQLISSDNVLLNFNLSVNINEGSEGPQPSDEGACAFPLWKMARPSRQIVKPLSSQFGSFCFPQWLFSVKAECGRLSVAADCFCQHAAILPVTPTNTRTHTNMNEHNTMACMRLESLPLCIVKPFILECPMLIRRDISEGHQEHFTVCVAFENR